VAKFWLVDLGIAGKVRPCLLLTSYPADDELAKPAEPKPLVVQLYNMDTDPTEQKNVAAENPAIVQRLETLLQEAWRAP